MKKTKIGIVALCFTLGISLFGCGAKGEKGATGATGATGAPGTQGPKGSDAIQYYPVTFRDEDGSILDIQFVEDGKSVTFDGQLNSKGIYNYKFTGWDSEFEIISGPTTITAQYDHSKLYFGSYPQTHVEDEELIALLNSKAGDLPNSTHFNSWTDYEYFINGNKESFMFYQDIDLDEDGTYDYRGVFFDKYRPWYTDDCEPIADYSQQDDYGYLVNNTYWFSYDPIEWNVLKKEKGKALIFSTIALDSHEYYNSDYNGEETRDNGLSLSPNNYEYSNIRKWLKENFYNTAFNYNEKGINVICEVDNSASSTLQTFNRYACNNTQDELFLLSSQEVVNYYPNISDRTSLVSDYAKCQGIVATRNKSASTYDFCNYAMLRSPYWFNGGEVDTISTTGNLGIDPGEFYANCNYTFIGIRPAMWIIL